MNPPLILFFIQISSYSSFIAADKNSSPKATDEFRRVTSAFEILGDPVSRKRYDRAIYEEANKRRRAQSRSHQRQQHHHQQQRQQQQSSSRKPNDMDTRKERQMRHTEMIHKSRSTQSRMTKIITKEEFETNMLDASKKFYKINCLIMFVANKNAEKWAETYLYFPFPFAGDGRHGNSYENLLLVSKVRVMYYESALSTCLNSRNSPWCRSPHKRFDSTPKQT